MKAIVHDRCGPPDVLQLRAVDEPQAGDGEVLVNGASGGVGTFAVQLAKAGRGGDRRVQHQERGHAGSLGADRVIDHTREDFTRGDRRYDLLLDVAGTGPGRRAGGPHPKARLVLVRAPKGSRLLGPLGHIGKVGLASLPAGQKVVFFISKSSSEDLTAPRELLEAGTVTPVAERT